MKTTVIEAFRKKKNSLSVFLQNVERCGRCKSSFRKWPLHIIYKDVCECGVCGNVLIVNPSDLIRFGKNA